MEELSGYQSMTFFLTVRTPGQTNEDQILECQNEAKCKIKFKRAYTPVLYGIKPQIVYYESNAEMWFDPRSTTDLISDLETDEMHFINAKVGGAGMKFDFTEELDDSDYSIS